MSQPVTHLLRIMSRLRSRRGCPWDREQTHRSLRRHLKSEMREVIEAIEKNDPHGLREELGDLLLLIVFHSQMAREKGQFSFDDVVRMLNRKLIRRHPHVFGNRKAGDTAAVLKQWHEIKAREKKDKRHVRHQKCFKKIS